MTCKPERQSNPFLPNYEPDPAMDRQIREALDSPEGRKMIQKMADDIDEMILADIRRKIESGEIK